MKYWVAALVFVVTFLSFQITRSQVRVLQLERQVALQEAQLSQAVHENQIQNQTVAVILQTVRLLTLSQKEAAAKGGQGL